MIKGFAKGVNGVPGPANANFMLLCLLPQQDGVDLESGSTTASPWAKTFISGGAASLS